MSYKENVSVYLVDDEFTFVDSVAGILRRMEGLEVVGSATTMKVALEEIEQLRPRVVFWDLWLQSSINGIRAIELTVRDFPETFCILMSHDVTTRALRDALAAGAIGVITKQNPSAFLSKAVRRAARGESVFDQVTSKMLADLSLRGGTLDVLTPREEEIWALFSKEGLSNKEVAQRLGVSPGNIRTHAQNLRAKLGVDSIRKAIVLWYKRDR